MEKIKYPWATCFILVNTFFERFAFYGIRTTMSLYLRDSLGVPEKDCTIIYHAFYMLAFFTPLIGAIISDSYLGNFNTILLFTGVFTGGSILLTLSAIPSLDLPLTMFCVLGLVLIAAGTGGLKPCIATFSGDQFQLPQQAVQLTLFFGLFYWSGTAANVGATFVAPILRSQVSCFGNNTCYPLIFIISSGLLLISFFVLLGSKRTFTVKKCEETSLLQILKCFGYALKHKMNNSRSTKGDNKSHWLDASSKKHGDAVVKDLKSALKLMVLYIPFPLFSTLLDQQGSKWIFQGSRMSAMIGNNYRMMPDQYQFLTRVMVLFLVPFLDRIVYPLLGKCNALTQPLHRIFVSGLFAAAGFVAAGLIELTLQRQLESKSVPLHLVWQFPQYVLLTVSELILVITAIDFSYSEAPKSMKSFMQAIWLVTAAVGNLLVIVISKMNIGNDIYEYFMYAAVMFCAMIWFLWISNKYISRKKAEPTISCAEEPIEKQLDVNEVVVERSPHKSHKTKSQIKLFIH